MSKLDTIQTALTKWAQWLVPTSSVKENYNFRSNELSYSANQLDVNRLRYLFASAESGNVMELFAMYRDVMIADPHIQAEFAKRKLAMLGDTIIIQPADKKIAVIKAVREVKAGLGLAEAKALVEGAPKTLLEGANKADTDAAKKKLEEAGAKVEVK